jgi:glycosyltransferase 2 family protein
MWILDAMQRRRRTLVRLALGTAATIAFLVLFLREVDLGQAWSQIIDLPGWTMLGALGLVLVNVVVMAVRWRFLLEGAGYKVPLRKLFSTVCVGRAANNVIPARGGDLIRIESMREVSHVPAFVSAGTLFAERLLDGVVLAAWILLGALAIGNGGIPLLTGIALSAGTTLGVVLVVVAAKRPDAAEAFVWRATKRLPARWHTRITRYAAHFVEGLGAFRGRRRLLFIFGTSTLMWLADVVMFAIVGNAYDLDLELGAYFLLEGIGNLALAVPTTAAGLGSFDYLTYLTARGIDVDEHTATAYVLTMHALIVLPVTILGALLVRPALPRLFRSRETAREAG